MGGGGDQATRRKDPVTLLPSKRHPWERQIEMHLGSRARDRHDPGTVVPLVNRLGQFNLHPASATQQQALRD